MLMFSLTFFTTHEANAQLEDTKSAFTVQGGYSWLNGVVGAEIQLYKIGFSGGYFPAKMPLTNDPISSFSFGISYYPRAFDDGIYLSWGLAGAGYRYETTNGDSDVKPMNIVMAGYRFWAGSLSMKGGAGYGWCSESNTFTGELTLGYSF